MEGGFFKENQKEAIRKSDNSEDLVIPISENEKCKYCSKIPIIIDVQRSFNINICKNCVYNNLKLIPKTECKKNYLLSECEIKQFKYISRPNPRGGTWSEMKLFKEDEIAEFAYKKYGSNEKLEYEKKFRLANAKKKKINKLKQSIKNMKKRTFLKKKQEDHKHKFKTIINGSEELGVCECGLEVSLEEI